MQCRDSAKLAAELNSVIDEILNEHQRKNLHRTRKSCNAEVREDTERDRSKQGKGDARRSRGVESSKRFSVRVMEAMRALQRQKEAQSSNRGRAPVCSSVCEIVEYVAENFRTDGDLDAQVRTALKRTCCQGFVKYERNDAYRLIGPFACQLAKTQNANCTTSMSSLTARRSIHDPCKQNNNPCNRNSCGDSDQVQENSELSIPTSVAEDILWNRLQNQRDPRQRNCNAGDPACPQNPCANNQNRNPGPRCRTRNNEQNCQRGNATNAPTVQNQSSAIGNEAVSTVLTPVGELEVTYSNGEDDDEDFGEGDEYGPRGADEDAEDDDEEEEGVGGDGASDDSLLHELDMRNRRPRNENRDQELKRWIRQCRKECERQAHRNERNQ